MRHSTIVQAIIEQIDFILIYFNHNHRKFGFAHRLLDAIDIVCFLFDSMHKYGAIVSLIAYLTSVYILNITLSINILHRLTTKQSIELPVNYGSNIG